MLTAFARLASTLPRLFVHLDLKPFKQIGIAGTKVDHRNELQDSLVIKAELPRRGSVDGQSVVAAQDRGNRDRDNLLRETVQPSGLDHDGLDFVPV